MASGPRKFRDTAADVWRVPEIAADRCVHSQLETASCRRCMTTCPRDAWVMDDEILGIDTAACDGCALCVPACREGAVITAYAMEIRRSGDGEDSGFAACEQASRADAPWCMPCIHAIALETLLRLYLRGVMVIRVARGDCTTCARGGGETLDGRVADLNSLLLDRGLPPMQVVAITPDHAATLRRSTGDATCAAMTRRGFLRAAMGRAADQLTPRVLPEVMLEPASAGRTTPPGRLLPRTGDDQPAFFAPVLDPRACNGCDACVRLCPHAALAMADGGEAYRIDADACSGCGICVDVCDSDALSLAAWAVPPLNRIALASGRCAGCGAAFHWPVARGTPAALCRICEATGRHRQLFQVMD